MDYDISPSKKSLLIMLAGTLVMFGTFFIAPYIAPMAKWLLLGGGLSVFVWGILTP